MPGEQFVQVFGKVLTIPLIEGWRPTRVYTTGSQRVHKISHVQPRPDIFRRMQLTSRTERLTALFNYLRRQGYIARNHQVTGTYPFHYFIVSHVKSAGNLKCFDMAGWWRVQSLVCNQD
jgi:hypothetical protein